MHETTQTEPSTDTPPEPPLGALLLRSAKYQSRGQRAATQALVEDGTLLDHGPLVRTLVVDGPRGRRTCDWDRLTGKLYTLGLGPEDRLFLGLLLSLVPVGSHTLSGVEHLTERRLVILLRAIVCLAGSDRVAIGTGL
ncbi:hypothetical protein [Streptomyces longwoodensis]|uniref:hypothetical protein n=1 Tax=Streptomyces longwoodensis TaxID=68231 RepID=UPI00225B8B20|nr:hypothetical protein [Streptomyces longwoodensis]MCX4994245.1 hypothetical protein [Streptomyces longwoodensis]